MLELSQTKRWKAFGHGANSSPPLPTISLLLVLSSFFSPSPFLPPLSSCFAKIHFRPVSPWCFPCELCWDICQVQKPCCRLWGVAAGSLHSKVLWQKKEAVWCWLATYIQLVVPFSGWAFIWTCLNGFCLTCRLPPQ